MMQYSPRLPNLPPTFTAAPERARSHAGDPRFSLSSHTFKKTKTNTQNLRDVQTFSPHHLTLSGPSSVTSPCSTIASKSSVWCVGDVNGSQLISVQAGCCMTRKHSAQSVLAHSRKKSGLENIIMQNWSCIEGTELEFCRRGREEESATTETAVYCSNLNIHTAARKWE